MVYRFQLASLPLVFSISHTAIAIEQSTLYRASKSLRLEPVSTLQTCLVADHHEELIWNRPESYEPFLFSVQTI